MAVGILLLKALPPDSKLRLGRSRSSKHKTVRS